MTADRKFNRDGDLGRIKYRLLNLELENVSGYGQFVNVANSLRKISISLEQIDDRAVLFVDTCLLWFTRIMQYAKKVGEAPRWRPLEMFLRSVFTYVTGMHHSSLGAFSNALGLLLKKLLQFVDTLQCDDANLLPWISCIYKRPLQQKSFFVLLEALIKYVPRTAKIISNNREFHIVRICLDAMKFNSLANSASKLLALHLHRVRDPNYGLYLITWLPALDKHLLDDVMRANIVTHLLPTLFRDVCDLYLDWLRSLDVETKILDQPQVMLPLLRAGMEMSRANDPFENKIVLESLIERLLCHSDRNTRLDAFAFVCATATNNTLPPPFVRKILRCEVSLRFVTRELLSPQDRTVFVTNLRNALNKLRGFTEKQAKKPSEEMKAQIVEATEICEQVFLIMCKLLVPDSSYAQLSCATEILYFIIIDEFDGVKRSAKLKNSSSAGSKMFHIFLDDLVRLLLRLTTNNYDDIRRKCSQMLDFCPAEQLCHIISENPLQNSLYLLTESKHGSSDSYALLFLTIATAYLKYDFELFKLLLEMLVDFLESSKSSGQHICGSLASISAILSVTNKYILINRKNLSKDAIDRYVLTMKATADRLVKFTTSEWREVSAKLSLNGEPQEADDSYWKTLKESALLIETLLDITVPEALVSKDIVVDIGIDLMEQLSTVSHRGSFSAALQAFIKCCSVCFASEYSEKPSQWLQYNLSLIETKRQLITRRSAGLPYLISGILIATVPQREKIKNFMEIAVKQLISTSVKKSGDSEETVLDLPQVNAFNCLTQIFKESVLKPFYQEYIADALDAALQRVDHPTWAIKNSALMLFTALYNSFFGSNQLDKTQPSISVDLFFSQFPKVQVILRSHLQKKSIDKAIPILSMLSRLHASPESRVNLNPFIDSVSHTYLGHLLWKIREAAALLICSMTRQGDIIRELQSMFPRAAELGNLAHGKLLCVRQLLQRLDSKGKDAAALAEVTSATWYNFNDLKDRAYLFKWVMLRSYLMVANELPYPPLGLHVVEESLKQCALETRGLDGSANLFVETAVSALLNGARTKDELINTSVRFFSAHHEGIVLTSCQFWLLKPALFREAKALHYCLLETLYRQDLRSHIHKEFVKLALEANLEVPIKMERYDSNEEMQSYSLCLHAAIKENDEEKFVPSCMSLMHCEKSQEIRLQAVRAAKKYLSRNNGKSFLLAQLAYELHQSESDESEIVRRSALPETVNFEMDVVWPFTFLGIYKEVGRKVLSAALTASLERNIDHFKLQLSTTLYDIEKTNLFRNEVWDFTYDATALFWNIKHEKKNSAEIINEILLCIFKVAHMVTEHEHLLHIWSYNVFLDTAVKKVAVLYDVGKDHELIQYACKPLLAKLEAAHYPF